MHSGVLCNSVRRIGMRWRNGTTAAVAATFLLFAAPVMAAPTPWVGSADYSAGANGDVTDGETVGPFDAYDAGPGVALTVGAGSAGVGATLDGYFQSYVTAHTRSSVEVTANNLNTQGAVGDGSGYELTVAANFKEKVTAINGGQTDFDIIGGRVDLYLDDTPDYSFPGDSGFTDNGSILSGTIVGGGGNFTTTPFFAFGGALIDIQVDSYDTDVFSPDTIASGASVFTLQITPNNAQFLSTISSVQGHPYDSGTDLLVVADGNLDLYAVPEPLSLLLVASALGGLVVVRRSR